MSRISVVLAAALAAATALPVQAAATSSATLGPLTVTLFDLDPTDGIAPSVTWLSGSQSYASASASEISTGLYDNQYAQGADSFEPIQISALAGLSSAQAYVDGPGTAVGTTVGASGTTLGTPDTAPLTYTYGTYNSAAWAPYYGNSFLLSSNTLMLISATSVLTAGVTTTWDPYANYQYESSWANTQLYVQGAGASGGGSQYASDSFQIGASSTYQPDDSCTYGYCYGPSSSSDTRTLAVSFANVSGGELGGSFQAYASAGGYSYAQAVPEPGTYGLMLAGLLSLGYLARRRGVGR